MERRRMSDVGERSTFGIMDRRRMSDVGERRPLIDSQKLRSCRSRSTPASRPLSNRPASVSSIQRAGSTRSSTLKPIAEAGRLQPSALDRSQSAPHHARSISVPQYALRSPQYRVNPVVKFDVDCLVPKRMNYGIAGYNTSRPRSCSGYPEKVATERTRPKSMSDLKYEPPRSRTVSVSNLRPATRPVIWRSFTRRVRDKMGRIRVRDTCSKLLSRLRG